MGMTAMLAMAEQYNNTLQLKDYLKALPESESYRLVFETMDEIGKKNHEMVKDVDGEYYIEHPDKYRQWCL